MAFAQEEGEWVTPPESAGLLPGVMRAELLDSGMLVERKVTLEDAISAAKAGRRIICFNSVRGLYDVELKLD
jgi:4-amino-4-deoxychorismate lyase